MSATGLTRRPPAGIQIDIAAVRAATDLVALIGEDIELRKAGRDYQARCPFHDEKTPSFTVSPGKQFFHCFGCGAHGDALSWMTEYRRIPFREALEILAGEAGISTTPIDNGATRERKAKRITSEVESALSHELHVLLSAVGSRVTHRAIPRATIEQYPHIQAPPDDPWEREYDAAKRIATALYALYGVRA